MKAVKKPLLSKENWLKNENTIRYYAEVKPYNAKQLCSLYEISDKTFNKWLAPFRGLIGEKNGYFYTVLQVEIIFLKFGIPYALTEEHSL